MKKLFLPILFILFYVYCGAEETNSTIAQQQNIQNVFNDAIKCWNNGDLKCFMQVLYINSDKTLFISGTKFIHGWNNSYAAYVAKYGNSKADMGKLTINFDEIRILDEDHALAYGRYQVIKNNKVYVGVTSLLLIKNQGQWKVLVDHSNANGT